MIRLILLCLVALLSLGCSDSLLYKVQDTRPAIIVYPDKLDFGSLTSGQERSVKEVIIINAGDGDLSVLSPFLFDENENYSISASVDEFIIEPGDLVVLEVYYEPRTFEHNESAIQILSNDEDNPDIIVPVDGYGDAPVMTVTPIEFDYGNITIGCDNEERITITNDGNMMLTIESIIQMVTQPSNIIMEYGSLPVPPWNIDPGLSIDFLVSYIPTDIGNDNSQISIVGNDPVLPALDVLQYGEGSVEKWFVETHIQEEIPVLDVLWVVDDSGSMNRFQNNLASNIGLFVNTFVLSGADYRMSVITTSDHMTGLIIDSTSSNAEYLIANEVLVGIGGSGMEKGIEMSKLALSNSSSAGPGGAFFRDSATLIVIYVSDEPDYSPYSWYSYLNFFDGLKPIGTFIPFGVIGDPPSGCSSINPSYNAQYGSGYWDLIDHYGGMWYSICAVDWGIQLQNLASTLSARRSYELLEGDPIQETITVSINGQEVSEWVYESSGNAVIFNEGSIPEEGQTIDIEYAVWGCGE